MGIFRFRTQTGQALAQEAERGDVNAILVCIIALAIEEEAIEIGREEGRLAGLEEARGGTLDYRDPPTPEPPLPSPDDLPHEELAPRGYTGDGPLGGGI